MAEDGSKQKRTSPSSMLPAMYLDYRIFEEVPVAMCWPYTILLEGEMGPHKESHVHLRWKKKRLASIGIRTGEVLAGEIPRKLRKIVERWVEKNRDELLEDWACMQLTSAKRKAEFVEKLQRASPKEYEFGPC